MISKSNLSELIKNGHQKIALSTLSGMITVLTALYREKKIDKECIYNFLNKNLDIWHLMNEYDDTLPLTPLNPGTFSVNLDGNSEALSEIAMQIDVFENCVFSHNDHQDHTEKGQCMNISTLERNCQKLMELN